MSQIFKIRQKSTGLFSTGGSAPSFTKNGKVWKRRGDLTSHLTLVMGSQSYYRRTKIRLGKVYDGCELVTFEMVAVETQDIEPLLEQVVDGREKREQERERDNIRSRCELLRKELEELEKLERKRIERRNSSES